MDCLLMFGGVFGSCSNVFEQSIVFLEIGFKTTYRFYLTFDYVPFTGVKFLSSFVIESALRSETIRTELDLFFVTNLRC